MILRKLLWILVCSVVMIIVECQHERSYDTNDWVPITPAPGAPEKKTIGRVLNLDAPAQKYLSEEEYGRRKRRPQVQQYLRESSFKPAKQKYRYDVRQQAQPSVLNPQYFPKQELATYERPPPLNQGFLLDKPVLTREQVPAPNAPNLYQQYNLPFNNSYYQSLNPSSINQELQGQVASPVTDDKQSVQLLYVPLENLQPNRQASEDSENIFQQAQPPRQIYTQNKQHLIDDIEHDLIQQTVQAHRLQQQIHLGRPPVRLQTTTTTTTTPKPTTKRKPHQPPLAVYLESNGGADVDDVLEALKDAKTIAVQDSVLPNSPPVFVGPSTLNLPFGYAKFPLPYINKLDGNRIERKIENLPFFVAPLSYKAPEGYTKITLPSPHVGSVIISNRDDSQKRSPQTPVNPNQISSYESTKAYAPPSGNPFYSTVTYAQKPQYLQFNVNDHVNQVSTKPQTQHQPLVNVNDALTSNQPTAQVGYSQSSSGDRPLQRVVADTTGNPYSTPVTPLVEKYNFGQNYQVPSTSTSSQDNTQYSQYTIDNSNPYQVPSRIPQRSRFPTTETPRTTPPPYSGPSPSYLSSAYQEVTTAKTTTSKPEEPYRYSYTTEKQKPNPLDLTINQYELHQINSQLGEDKDAKDTTEPYDFRSHFTYDDDKPKKFDYSSHFEAERSNSKGNYGYSSIFDVDVDEKPKYDYGAQFERFASTPATILRDVTTTQAPVSRRRGRPTIKTTTENPLEKESYTVLEEYSAKPSATETPKDALEYKYQIQTEAVDAYTTEKVREPATTLYDNTKTVIENIPGKVYSLGENQDGPVYTHPNLPTTQPQRVLDQHLMDKQILQQGNQEVSHQPEFIQSPLTDVFYKEEPVIEPLVHNRGQTQDSSYNGDLQDQAVVPDPTPEYQPAVEYTTTTTTTSTTTTTTTTERPVTRARGRQRGGSRFSTASATTPAVPRRTVNRRRPVHASRTTTTTEATANEDVQRVNTRQRFRTRGRPSQAAVTERISSTENEVRSYREPTSETPADPQSYIQFEHTVTDQKLVVQPEEVVTGTGTDYPQYYNAEVAVTDNPRFVLQYDNTATTHSPLMDVQVTHPVPKAKKPVTSSRASEENQVHLHAGGVLHNDDTPSPRKPTRGRARVRARTRVATTTEPSIPKAKPQIRVAPKRTTTPVTTTTTQKSFAKTAAEEEFFGFIRQPNFNQIYNIETTQQPVAAQTYQNTDAHVSTYQVFGNPNRNPKVQVQSYQIPVTQPIDDVRLDFSNNNIPSDGGDDVQFIGEIRPKYRLATTQSYEDGTATTTDPVRETETPRPRLRSRVRVPKRRPNTNEISTSRSQQQQQPATRRSNVSRSRGRAHYRPRQRQQEDKDADVEGGNYPPQFFQNRQAATSKPSFQISIDGASSAEEEDQQPHASLYQPKVVARPDEWIEATQNTAIGEEYAPANDLEDDIRLEAETITPDKSQVTLKETEVPEAATDQPVALPVTVGEELTTQNSDEAYKDEAKAIEQLFEDVNKTEEPKKRKKGVWKLVKQRPVDAYEVAESQNYYSVVNAFEEITKVGNKKADDTGHLESYNNYNQALEQNSDAFDYESRKLLPSTTSEPGDGNKATKHYEVYDLNAATEDSVMDDVNSTTSKPTGLFDTIYEMFGISGSKEAATTETPATTTVAAPTFPEEITETPTTTAAPEASGTTTEKMAQSTTQGTQLTRTYEVEPWEMKAVKTSTTTEVSHETEICYRGKCVRTTDRTGL